MKHSHLSYVFEDDRVLAFNGRSVVASAPSLEELESKLANDDADEPHCPTCNGTGKKGADNTACPACNGTGCIISDAKEASVDMKTANVVVTPNGLRGKIMGHAKDIWGDTVTVRFDNGNIRELPVTASLKFASEEEISEMDPLDELQKRFEASYSQTSDGLKIRQVELDSIREAGRHMASTRKEAAELMVQADYESREIAEALEHISSVEAIAPPKREWATYEQADLGRSSSVIDSMYEDMQREAAATDYEALLTEGPEVFVAGLNDSIIADVPMVRGLAGEYVSAKIAMAEKDVRDQFTDAFQDRVEAVRRKEVTARRSTVNQKQAKIKEDVDSAPDEALFG